MEWASERPPPPPPKSECEEFLQARLFEELAARDRLNRDTDERSEQFIAAAQDIVYYDPAFVDFFTQSRRRIADLKAKIARVRAGDVSRHDIEETKKMVSAVIGLFNDQPESLQRSISSLERKTQVLMNATIPTAITAYERELVENRALRRRLEELESNA
jgi:hypothetical protein